MISKNLEIIAHVMKKNKPLNFNDEGYPLWIEIVEEFCEEYSQIHDHFDQEGFLLSCGYH